MSSQHGGHCLPSYDFTVHASWPDQLIPLSSSAGSRLSQRPVARHCSGTLLASSAMVSFNQMDDPQCYIDPGVPKVRGGKGKGLGELI